MRPFFLILIIGCFFFNCKSNYNRSNTSNEKDLALVENDTVSISNPDEDYEIIIIEPGFNAWLQSTARPRGYYSQNYLENRNYIYVREWNLRFQQPQRFNSNLYMLPIDYNRSTDYGYEVNYKLYNYFIYFQLKYKQRLGTWIPRI